MVYKTYTQSLVLQLCSCLCKNAFIFNSTRLKLYKGRAIVSFIIKINLKIKHQINYKLESNKNIRSI